MIIKRLPSPEELEAQNLETAKLRRVIGISLLLAAISSLALTAWLGMRIPKLVARHTSLPAWWIQWKIFLALTIVLWIGFLLGLLALHIRKG